MEAISLQGEVPDGTYVVHGTFSVEGLLPEAYKSCCIWVNAKDPTQSSPKDFTDPQIYSLGESFDVEGNLTIWLVFANKDYISSAVSSKQEQWEPLGVNSQGTCTVSDCYIEAVGMSTYSLRGP
jgi:hypothetical protein